MQADKITLTDLAIFNTDEEFSLFHKINFTKTQAGREWLRRYFQEPHSTLEKIGSTQRILQLILDRLPEWPSEISNGTVIMIDKFLDYNLDPVPEPLNPVNSLGYKVFSSADYSMVQFSISHFADFYRGLSKLVALFGDAEPSPQFAAQLQKIKTCLAEAPLLQLSKLPANSKLSRQQNLFYARNMRTAYRSATIELIDVYGRLEAWYSMALAMRQYNLQFPQFSDSAQPFIEAQGIYHILLQKPVPYNLHMNPAQNFLFLTGANMAGKSTFIKALGAAVFMAHLGMGVPAQSMQLSLFDGLLTNINVADNISRGESYFFNEVQRIKTTIYKINDGRKWLVLIDELFKGTNVQDAMKCSLAVIKGLIKMQNSLFVLSTHLYEIGDELKHFSNISFKFFETTVTDDQLSFSYQLKEGISNDRIGYLILKREKVVEMLDKL